MGLISRVSSRTYRQIIRKNSNIETRKLYLCNTTKTTKMMTQLRISRLLKSSLNKRLLSNKIQISSPTASYLNSRQRLQSNINLYQYRQFSTSNVLKKKDDKNDKNKDDKNKNDENKKSAEKKKKS